VPELDGNVSWGQAKLNQVRGAEVPEFVEIHARATRDVPDNIPH
jgi:hypothetical protein